MYKPTKWEDHVVAPRNEIILEHIEGDRYRIANAGEVINKGTLLSAENFNKHEHATFETLVALCSMLQKTLLHGDKLDALEGQLAKSPFFLTDERTVTLEDFAEGLSFLYTVKFSDANIRSNTEYIAIPFITEMIRSEGAASNYANTPLIYVQSKNTGQMQVRVCRPDPGSAIGNFTFRFLVVGGM